MDNPLSFSSEDGFVQITLSGNLDAEALPQLKEDIEAWKKFLLEKFEEGKKKIKVLVDASAVTERYHPGALTELSSLAKWGKEYIERTAIFGIPELLRVSAAMVKLLGGRENMEFFRGKGEAIEWLNDSQSE